MAGFANIREFATAHPRWTPSILPATGVWSEKDLVNQVPSLPRIEDGACLAWLLFGVGATTTASPFLSRVDVGWG